MSKNGDVLGIRDQIQHAVSLLPPAGRITSREKLKQELTNGISNLALDGSTYREAMKPMDEHLLTHEQTSSRGQIGTETGSDSKDILLISPEKREPANLTVSPSTTEQKTTDGQMPSGGHFVIVGQNSTSRQVATDGHIPSPEHLPGNVHSRAEQMPNSDHIASHGHLPTHEQQISANQQAPSSEQLPNNEQTPTHGQMPVTGQQSVPNLIGYLVVDPSCNKPLCGRDVVVLNFLIEHNPYTNPLRALATTLSINYGTLRHCLTRLEAMQYFRTQTIMKGSLKSTTFILNPEKCMNFKADLNRQITNGFGQMFTHGQMSSHEQMPVLGQKDSSQWNKHQFEQMPRPGQVSNFEPQHTSLDRKIKKNLSIYEDSFEAEAQKLYTMDNDDFELFYPDLLKVGFGPQNIRSVLERRAKAGLDLGDTTIKMIITGLRNANATLQIGNGTLDPAVATKVERDKIPGYIFTCLAKNCSFPEPSGWEPEELLQLRKESQRLQEENELREKIRASKQAREETDGFTKWLDSLESEERQNFERESPSQTEDGIMRYLRHIWKKLSS